MTKTLAKMAIHCEENGSNERRTGRKSAYCIPDVIGQGVGKMMTPDQGKEEDGGEDEDNSEIRSALEPEDLLVET